ncbi:hypothetical protein [Arthrobacter sp. KNU40]|uniref:hypothetical protein n=1 Tax=Arthrobacter sp. KNU40 TaxID=3447965 RepID=UPI003F637FAC
MLILAAGSLIYGVVDVAQSNWLLGIVKLLFAAFAASLGVYFVRKTPPPSGQKESSTKA